MRRLIGLINNWLFRRRTRRVEKDALIFQWAFSDAQPAVSLYREHFAACDNARKKLKRARRKDKKEYWKEEEEFHYRRMTELKHRFPGIYLRGDNAVLEATLYLVRNFYSTHKHMIFGQYK